MPDAGSSKPDGQVLHPAGKPSALPRAALLGLAFIVTGVLLIYPQLIVPKMGHREHMALPVLLFGVSGAFISGLGFQPDSSILRALFHPLTALVSMAAGAALLLVRY